LAEPAKGLLPEPPRECFMLIRFASGGSDHYNAPNLDRLKIWQD